MIQFSQGLVENLEASFVFWVIDVSLIVVLVPVVLSWRDNRRWRPFRQQMGSVLFTYRQHLTFLLHSYSVGDPSDWDPDRLKGLERNLRDRISVTLIGVNAEIAPLISEAFVIAEKMNEVVNAYDFIADEGASILKSSSSHPFAEATRVISGSGPELILEFDRIVGSMDGLYSVPGYKPLSPTLVHRTHSKLLAKMILLHDTRRSRTKVEQRGHRATRSRPPIPT